MLLSYTKLVEDIANAGVITQDDGEPIDLDQVNGASIDIRLGDAVMVERQGAPDLPYMNSEVDLMAKETLNMEKIIIPDEGFRLLPGQFILASSSEKFFLPDNIVAEYVLKSSLARCAMDHMLAGYCFTGDTKIPTLDGRDTPIRDLVGKEDIWVYALDENGEFVPAKAENIRITSKVNSMIKITLDNGESFECTPDHKIMVRSGQYVKAKDLKENDPVMPLYLRTNSNGHAEVYSPSNRLKGNWQTFIGKWKSVHREVYKSINGSLDKGFDIHHLNGDKLNNLPDNLQKLTSKDHIRLHNRERNVTDTQKKIASETMKKTITGLWNDENYVSKMKSCSSKKAKDWNSKLWANVEHKAKMSKLGKIAAKNNFSKIDNKSLQLKAKLGMIKSIVLKLIDLNLEVSESKYLEYKRQNYPTIETINLNFGSFESALSQIDYKNHKVKTIEIINYDEPINVYDMTIPKYHNFAISSGVFVHNCDPWWNDSHLTLEFKNNSQFHTLVLKKSMKIGQMKFYKVDHVPHESGYAVHGQYNNSHGVTGSGGLR